MNFERRWVRWREKLVAMSARGLGTQRWLHALAVFSLGCASLRHGTRAPVPASTPDTSSELRRVGTDEVDGVRVLWHAAASGRTAQSESWLASNQGELVTLWRLAGSMAATPVVDFTRYLVFGLSHAGSYCQPEISSASFDPSGVVRLYAENEASLCVDVAVRVSLVVALPRRILKPQILLVAPGFDHAYQFSVPPQSSAPVALARFTPAATEADRAAQQTVPLPELGHLALATLRDGSQIWVAREANGSVSVFSAVASIERWPLERLPEYLWTAVQWRPEIGRFQGGWDWQGRNAYGFAPLTAHRWQLDDGKLLVGGSMQAPPGPIRPRRFAPQLDGPARAYLSPRRSAWPDLREGELALVDLDLVSSPALGVRLCPVPKEPESLNHFRGCPADAPRVTGAPEHPRTPPFVLDGPFILRRIGNSTRVILTTPTPNQRTWAPPGVTRAPLQAPE